MVLVIGQPIWLSLFGGGSGVKVKSKSADLAIFCILTTSTSIIKRFFNLKSLLISQRLQHVVCGLLFYYILRYFKLIHCQKSSKWMFSCFVNSKGQIRGQTVFRVTS